MREIILSPHQSPSIAYHNVEEIVPTEHGLMLHRVSEDWRQLFPEQTAFRATQTAGVELRFRAATRHVALELSTENNIGYSAAVALYHGYANVGLATLPTSSFSGQVILMERQDDIADVLDAPWRIILPYGAVTAVKALYLSDGAEVLPTQGRSVRWLAHGDSITQGAHALHPGMTYVHLVGDALGWDAINQGYGGSAWGDAAVAEYIASRRDWDILSIAIGTNTYGGARESASDYAVRYEQFLAIIRAAHPQKPILCITPTWRGQDGPPEMPNRFGDSPRAYREAITKVITRRQRSDPRLSLLDGLQLIGGPRGLGVDRLHPDMHGMSAMAQGIALALRNLI